MSVIEQDKKSQEVPGGLADIDPEAESGAAPVVWEFGKDAEKTIYVQKPLSFRAKLEWTGLLGRTLDDLMGGERGLTLDGIIGGGPNAEEIQLAMASGNLAGVAAQAMGGIDDFVRAVVRVAGQAPGFWDECVCIWLRVPYDQRPWLIDLMQKPVDEGGLSDDDGFKILTTFVGQNWVDTERFFVERLQALVSAVRTKRKEAGLARSADDSVPSKLSKRTRRRTGSQ